MESLARDFVLVDLYALEAARQLLFLGIPKPQLVFGGKLTREENFECMGISPSGLGVRLLLVSVFNASLGTASIPLALAFPFVILAVDGLRARLVDGELDPLLGGL